MVATEVQSVRVENAAKLMNDSEHSVSVIVPAFNCAGFVGEAVESVLRQGTSLHELIVVDDGSTDDTPAALRCFGDRVYYVHQENSGVSAARNRGLHLASGRWVLFLDADDRLAPKALSRLVDIGRVNTSCVIYGERVRIDEQGTDLGGCDTRDCRGPVPTAGVRSFTGAPFSPGSAIVPRELALDIGGFDERFSTCADRHFWIRCGAVAEFKRCESVTYHYRVRENSMSCDRALNAVERVKVQFDSLQWCEVRKVQLFEKAPTTVELLEQSLKSAYWNRRWRSVDALLNFADELEVSGEFISRVRRRRRLGPLVFSILDCFINR